MAEERLIDDDKDKKYRIRKNADGEDELFIDESDDSEEDLPLLEIYDSDSEIAEDLSADEAAEREKIRLEAAEAAENKFNKLVGSAEELLKSENFEGALYSVTQAEELKGDDKEVCFLKLKAITRNFTDFTSLEKCAQAADKAREYCDEQQKLQLKSLSEGLQSRIDEAQNNVLRLEEQNECGKSERRRTFADKKRKTFNYFLSTLVPFIVALALTISFGAVIFSREDGAFIIATAVCGGLSAAFLLATLFTAKSFWAAARNVKRNESDTSTKIGRDFLEAKKQLGYLNRINSAFNDDLS